MIRAAFQYIPWERWAKKQRNWLSTGMLVGSLLDPQSINNILENSFKNQSRTSMSNYTNMFQNGAETNAPTHPKSMPTLVSKKMGNTMTIVFFESVKNMRIHCKGHRTWRFCKAVARMGKPSTNHLNLYQTSCSKLMSIGASSILAKIVQTS